MQGWHAFDSIMVSSEGPKEDDGKLIEVNLFQGKEKWQLLREEEM